MTIEQREQLKQVPLNCNSDRWRWLAELWDKAEPDAHDLSRVAFTDVCTALGICRCICLMELFGMISDETYKSMYKRTAPPKPRAQGPAPAAKKKTYAPGLATLFKMGASGTG